MPPGSPWCSPGCAISATDGFGHKSASEGKAPRALPTSSTTQRSGGRVMPTDSTTDREPPVGGFSYPFRLLGERFGAAGRPDAIVANRPQVRRIVVGDLG